jgi:hypothetical protein
MRGRTYGGERVKEGFENAGLAEPFKAFPYAVPRAEALRTSAPPDVLDCEEMERFEEAAVVLGFPSGSWQARPETQRACAPILPRPSLSTCAPASDSVGDVGIMPGSTKIATVVSFSPFFVVAGFSGDLISPPAKVSSVRQYLATVIPEVRPAVTLGEKDSNATSRENEHERGA